MTKETNKLPTLENAFTEISDIIDKMEHAPLTLEQSLAQFERGITLIKHAQKILTEAEQKVQILLQQNGQEKLVNYDENDRSDSNDDNAS